MDFPVALEHVLKWEGGFSDHPEDPGAATKYGITLDTLKRWRGQRPTTAADVRSLTKVGASEIYETWYWRFCSCHRLPSGVDLIVFDCAVNQGPRRAISFLQQAAKAKVDGAIGPKTLAAVANSDPKGLILDIAAARACHYATLNSTFHRGWFKRLLDTYCVSINNMKD